MTNLGHSIAAASGSSTTALAPPRGGLIELFERLAKNSFDSLTGRDSKAVFTRKPIGILASGINAAANEKQSLEQLKTNSAAYAAKCWRSYARLYPEAFSNRSALATKTPELIFTPTQARFNMELRNWSKNNVIAFVRHVESTPVYVNTTKFKAMIKEYGPDSARYLLSHELIHCLAYPFTSRIRDDESGERASYRGVQEDVASTFKFYDAKSGGITNSFSVRELIGEFAAEYFSSKATGLRSFSSPYAPIRATGNKLLQLVGEKVFRKAVLGNEPLAYRQVVQAAKALQVQNARMCSLQPKG